MRMRAGGQAKVELEEARRQLDRWRRNRQGYGRIPDELWRKAAQAAAVYLWSRSNGGSTEALAVVVLQDRSVGYVDKNGTVRFLLPEKGIPVAVHECHDR